MGIAVGIDLGTTNSVVSRVVNGETDVLRSPKGSPIFPSVVHYKSVNEFVVGASARRGMVTDPENTVYSAKRLIGQDFRSPSVQLLMMSLPYGISEGGSRDILLTAGGKTRSVPEISGDLLSKLKEKAEAQWGDEVVDAVITVPANFADAQRKATRQAGELAGLNVLRLINEPTAASLAYGYGQENKDGLILVYDLGGGTFDVSLIRISGQVFEVLSSSGDFFLGGDDFDRTISTFLVQEFSKKYRLDLEQDRAAMARIRVAAETIKKRLSSADVADGTIDRLHLEGKEYSLPFHLDRTTFEGMISGYLDRTMELCDRLLLTAGISAKDLDEVVCVGGSTRIPMVRQLLSERLGMVPRVDIDPDEVVARGAAVQAASLSMTVQQDDVAEGLSSVGVGLHQPLLLDVVPASFGISTVGGFSDAIIRKNDPIPIEKSKVFTTSHDKQESVRIQCCRGESKRYEENEFLGEIVLEELPALPRGELEVEVVFGIDADGTMQVDAINRLTGESQKVSFAVAGFAQD